MADDIEDTSAPLIEHLAELRTRILHSLVAFAIGMVLCFTVAEPILQFLLGPIEETLRDLGDPAPVMQYTSPQEYFFTLIRISMVFGLGLSFPYISYQMWRFVAPGLYRTEKNAFLPFLIASPVLFLVGASFAHFVVTPLAMAFFLGFADISSVVSRIVVGTGEVAPVATGEGLTVTFFGKVNESLDITLKFIMAFGLCFQLPVLLTLMGKAGLVTATGLRGVRKYAVVGILVLAAVVTPPDVVTQMILFVAVYGLYEISIHLVALVQRRQEARLRAEGILDEGESLYDPVDEAPGDAGARPGGPAA